MHSSTILRRTEAGEAELAVAAHGLSLTQRRFLTLLDTSCRVDQLALRHPADPEKFERDVSRLAQMGLIACDAPLAPDAAPVPPVSAVRLGAPRFARRMSLALVALVALTWLAWDQFGIPSAPKLRRDSVPGTSRATVSPASEAIAPEPAPIATRVLRSDPLDRTRAAKDPHAGIASVQPAAPKRAVEPVDTNAGATTLPERVSNAADRVNAMTPDANAPPAEPRPAHEKSSVAIPDAVVAAPATAPTPAAPAPVIPASVTTAGPGATPASAALPAAPSSPAPAEPHSSDSTPIRLASAAPAAGLLRGATAPNLVPILRDAPDFPREAIALGLASGTVKARLTVDTKGNVSNVDIVEASHRAFDRAVREALARWRFQPGAGGRTTTVDVAFKRD